MIGVTALLVGTAIYYREPLTDTYYQITEQERNWVKGSSPLREPLEDVWHQWRGGDLTQTEAVKLIEKTIADELPSGSSEEEIRDHIRKHFKNPGFGAYGARIETAYWIDCYGTTAFMDMEVLQLWYISHKDKFLGAELHMAVPKGQDLRKISLRSSNGDTDHRVSYPGRTTQAEQDAALGVKPSE